ncbi:MAG: hypothetical protein AB7K04_09800 [Pseudorhodoplanes sp.]
MREARYCIVQNDEAWLIRFQDEEFGPYQSRAEAVLFAVEAARKIGQQGARSAVGILGENGHFLPEWTYGEEMRPAVA